MAEVVDEMVEDGPQEALENCNSYVTGQFKFDKKLLTKSMFSMVYASTVARKVVCSMIRMNKCIS